MHTGMICNSSNISNILFVVVIGMIAVKWSKILSNYYDLNICLSFYGSMI